MTGPRNLAVLLCLLAVVSLTTLWCGRVSRGGLNAQSTALLRGGAAPSARHFHLGDLGASSPSKCIESENGNLMCVFRHACWTRSRPGVITVLPHTTGPNASAAWPDPYPTRPPPLGFDSDSCEQPCNRGKTNSDYDFYTNCPMCKVQFTLETRDAARPEGHVMLVDGATALVAIFQDHMPNFAQQALNVGAVVTAPARFDSAPFSHLLIEVYDPQPVGHPREWMRTLMDLMHAPWRTMLFSRPPLQGKSGGLLRAAARLGDWLSPSGGSQPRLLFPGESARSAGTFLGDVSEELLSSNATKDFSVCFEALWWTGGRWSFNVDVVDLLRARVHAVLELPAPAPRDLCVLNRASSRAIANADEVVRALRAHATKKTVRLFYLEGTNSTEQIRLLSTCAMLITPHGANVANAIFMPRGAVVVEVFAWSFPRIHRPFRAMCQKAGLVHANLQATRDELRPAVNGSCGHCWNVSWSGFTEREMGECASIHAKPDPRFGPTIDHCHFCAKGCATRVDVDRHKDVLLPLIRQADSL